MTISLTKTQAIIFGKTKEEANNKAGDNHPPNKRGKNLGIILDQKLNFLEHY